MPQFSNTPPADPRGHALPLRRTPYHRPLVAIVTCDDLVGCPTHYWGGRTIPCEAQDCEPCLAGSGWRWHGYVSAYEPSLKLHFLLEVTGRCSEAFTNYRKANGTLRGCLFEASRPNAKHNGRVYIKTKTADLQRQPIPDPPNVKQVLSLIWNIPYTDIADAMPIKDAPAISVNTRGNGQQWKPESITDGT
ncbi:MAG: hypothetical protein ACYTG0_40340 [Planctomycetota bacterium]